MKTFFLFLLLLPATISTAQSLKPVPAKRPLQEWVISINPVTLISYDKRVMFGVERRFAPRWSVLADAGAVLSSSYIQSAERARGFELRPALRYYPDKELSAYIQGQLQYRFVRYGLHDWLGKDCVAGVPAYEQLQDFDYQKTQFGGSLVTRGIVRLGMHWLLDISVGIGVQYRNQQVSSEANCCYVARTNIFGGPQQEDMLIPLFPMAVRLGYVIK